MKWACSGRGCRESKRAAIRSDGTIVSPLFLYFNFPNSNQRVGHGVPGKAKCGGHWDEQSREHCEPRTLHGPVTPLTSVHSPILPVEVSSQVLGPLRQEGLQTGSSYLSTVFQGSLGRPEVFWKHSLSCPWDPSDKGIG